MCCSSLKKNECSKFLNEKRTDHDIVVPSKDARITCERLILLERQTQCDDEGRPEDLKSHLAEEVRISDEVDGFLLGWDGHGRGPARLPEGGRGGRVLGQVVAPAEDGRRPRRRDRFVVVVRVLPTVERNDPVQVETGNNELKTCRPICSSLLKFIVSEKVKRVFAPPSHSPQC